MEKYLSVLSGSRLFSGMGDDEILAMLDCLQPREKSYEKGETVFHQGEFLLSLAFLAEGRMHIQKQDYWGNLSILNEILPGQLFGEACAVPDGGPIMNDVVAMEKSTVLFFDMDKVLTVCSSACPYHTRLVKNLFYSISDTNRHLVRKLDYMARRTTREKLLSYLSDESRKQNSSSITIPFNRQQLADYIAVDRSAMSNELSKMRSEGILDYHKNSFTLRGRH